MPAIAGTHRPAGDPRGPGGVPPTVRYDAQPAWPGITTPHDARCWGCTWAWRGGRMEIKYLHALCDVREHRRAAG